jgi:hypothetical protein
MYDLSIVKKNYWIYDEDVATKTMTILATQAQHKWQMSARPIDNHVLKHADLIVSITCRSIVKIWKYLHLSVLFVNSWVKVSVLEDPPPVLPTSQKSGL